MKRFSEWSGEGATAAAPPSGFPAFSAKLLGAGADSRRENKAFLISFRFQPRGTGTSSLHTPAPRSSAKRSYITNFISFHSCFILPVLKCPWPWRLGSFV